MGVATVRWRHEYLLPCQEEQELFLECPVFYDAQTPSANGYGVSRMHWLRVLGCGTESLTVGQVAVNPENFSGLHLRVLPFGFECIDDLGMVSLHGSRLSHEDIYVPTCWQSRQAWARVFSAFTRLGCVGGNGLSISKILRMAGTTCTNSRV